MNFMKRYCSFATNILQQLLSMRSLLLKNKIYKNSKAALPMNKNPSTIGITPPAMKNSSIGQNLNILAKSKILKMKTKITSFDLHALRISMIEYCVGTNFNCVLLGLIRS